MLLLGFSERDLKPKRGLPLRSPAWDLALGAGPARPGPKPHPHLHAFTQPWRRPNLYPRSPDSPRPLPQPKHSSRLPRLRLPPPLSPVGIPSADVPPLLLHPLPPPLTLPGSPPARGASPAAPTFFPAPPLAPRGGSRFGHPEAARPDSPYRAGGLGPRRGARGPGPRLLQQLLTTSGGSQAVGSSGRIRAPRRPPRRHRPAPARRVPPGSCSFSLCPHAGPPGASWEL